MQAVADVDCSLSRLDSARVLSSASVGNLLSSQTDTNSEVPRASACSDPTQWDPRTVVSPLRPPLRRLTDGVRRGPRRIGLDVGDGSLPHHSFPKTTAVASQGTPVPQRRSPRFC